MTIEDVKREPTADEIERVEKALRTHIITHEGETLTLSDLMSSAFGDDGDYADRALAVVAPALALAAILAMDRRAETATGGWRYEIQYGPEGEANYAWVYDGMGQMITTARTHHAKQIVDALNASPPAPAVAVKPLEWTGGHGDDYRFFKAETGVGRFIYGVDSNGQAYYQTPAGPVDCETEDEARAEAEAGYIGSIIGRAQSIGLTIPLEAIAPQLSGNPGELPAPAVAVPEGWRHAVLSVLEPLVDAAAYYTDGQHRTPADGHLPCGPALLVKHLRAAAALANKLAAAPEPPATRSEADIRNEGREDAARFVMKRLDDYIAEHGISDPETGAVEFPGTGDEYVGELDEIVDGIRALKEPRHEP